MTDLETLFRVVNADRSDHTARLALADCLEEHGNSDAAAQQRAIVKLEQLEWTIRIRVAAVGIPTFGGVPPELVSGELFARLPEDVPFEDVKAGIGCVIRVARAKAFALPSRLHECDAIVTLVTDQHVHPETTGVIAIVEGEPANVRQVPT